MNDLPWFAQDLYEAVLVILDDVAFWAAHPDLLEEEYCQDRLREHQREVNRHLHAGVVYEVD